MAGQAAVTMMALLIAFLVVLIAAQAGADLGPVGRFFELALNGIPKVEVGR